MSNLEKKIKLLPCPFCGGEAKLVKRSNKYECKYAIGCSNVYCQSSVWLPDDVDLDILHTYLMCFRLEKDCISSWNKRIPHFSQVHDVDEFYKD